MGKCIDLIGQKFGRLTVVQKIDNDKWGHHQWLCKCNCEDKNAVTVLGNSLKNNKTKSCGCLQKEIVTKIMTKHGHSKRGKESRTYRSRIDMIQRCSNPNNKYWQDYGGRGITVCQRWLNSFLNFLEDMGEAPPGLQLDRIKNGKGYYKKNCHWVTSKINNRNKRNSRSIIVNGKTLCLIELAQEYNIPYSVLYQRIYKYGWSVKRALTTPVNAIQRRN